MAKEIYATHGIFFFEKNEDVKVFDAITDEEILEHTLDEFVDQIELSEPDYDVTSPYYTESDGEFTYFTNYDRHFYRLTSGPAYVFGFYDGTDMVPLVLSLDENSVSWQCNNIIPAWYQHVTFSFTYNDKTWYADGFGFGVGGNEPNCGHYVDISGSAPFASNEAKAIACLQAVYS